jgi:hypothetical protein
MEDSQLQIIPDELLENIIMFLPVNYLVVLSHVCIKLYNLVHNINYFKNNILKNIDNNKINKIIDYIDFTPKCALGIKQFKNINLWNTIPIQFNYNIYLYQILHFENFIINYLPKCNNVISLIIEYNFTQYIIEYIKSNIPNNIKKLTLLFSNNLIESFLEFKSSNYLYVTNIKLINFNLNSRSDFSNLSTLELNNVSIYITEEQKIQLSNINNLSIIYNLYIDDLSFLKNNKTLRIEGCNTSQELFIALSKNKKLKHLTIGTYSNTSTYDLSVFKDSNLEYLKLSYFGKYILNLNGLENIKKLDLNGIRVSNIHKQMNNKVLNLANCNIKQHMVPKLLNIEKLNISNNPKVKDTKLFYSKDCNIKVLNLSYNYNITNIDKLINLEELIVIGCNPYIKTMNNLSIFKKTKLYIENCYCKICINLYKRDIKYMITKDKLTTLTCLYEDKFDWF